MNTDDLPQQKVDELRRLLDQVGDEEFKTFIAEVRHPVAAYRAHSRARVTIPDGKDQQRYLKKLETKISRLNTLASELSDLLNDTPTGLRRRARAAQAPVEPVQRDLLMVLLQALNDFTPAKSTFHPETGKTVRDLAAAFQKAFELPPLIRAFRKREDIPETAPTPERLVPVVAILLQTSVDHAYRVSQRFLPS